MATVRIIQNPPDLAGASGPVLSPDGKTVACRLEGDRPGLYAFDVGGASRPLRLDEPGKFHHAPSWSTSGDLLFRISGGPGLPGTQVAAIPAFGRGGAVQYDGCGIAVSADGRVVAVADPRARALMVSVADAGNSPFHLPLKRMAELEEIDPQKAMEMELSRDGAYVYLVRNRAPFSPSLWSFSVKGGDAQEMIPQVPPQATLSFAVSKALLAVLEIRQNPGQVGSSRVYVRPLAAGSLGAVRLGPARDLLLSKVALPPQRPAFSPDGKKLAIVGPEVADSTTPTLVVRTLDLLPTAGGKPERATQTGDLRGSPRFLENGEVVVDGIDRVSVVTL